MKSRAVGTFLVLFGSLALGCDSDVTGPVVDTDPVSPQFETYCYEGGHSYCYSVNTSTQFVQDQFRSAIDGINTGAHSRCLEFQWILDSAYASTGPNRLYYFNDWADPDYWGWAYGVDDGYIDISSAVIDDVETLRTVLVHEAYHIWMWQNYQQLGDDETADNWAATCTMI